MLTRYAYKMERPILYGDTITERLYGRYINPLDIPKIGGHRRILPGVFLGNNNRPISRSKILSPYTSNGTTVIVDNPWAHKVGDVLKVIGSPSAMPNEEYTAIASASAAAFGTITAISPVGDRQVTTVTVASPAIGNVFNLIIDGVSFSHTATTTVAADTAIALVNIFNSQKSQTSSWADIDASAVGGVITFTHRFAREVFVISSSVVQGSGATTGTATVSVTSAIGALTITPATDNGNHAIGTKIGTITDIPLGVVTEEYYLTDNDLQDRPTDLSVVTMGTINIYALPYIDGHLTKSLTRLSWMPVY